MFIATLAQYSQAHYFGSFIILKSGNEDWIWLGDEEEAIRDRSEAGFWFIRSDPRRRPTYTSSEDIDSAFASAHRIFQKSVANHKTDNYSKFAQTLMPTFASSTSIHDGTALTSEHSEFQKRFKLMFKFTAAAVNRLSEHHIRNIRSVLKGNGYFIPGGVYPTMDAFYHKSPIRYLVLMELCSLQVATEELFGAYDMYHFRSDIRGSNGRVYIDDSGGSTLHQAIDKRMCGIFGFQGYHNGEKDPSMKPSVSAPLYGVEPGSKTHIDYILNVRGQFDDALIAVFGREICSIFFDPMRPVRKLWPKLAKIMHAMGDEDDEDTTEVDEGETSLFSSDDEEDGQNYDSFEWIDVDADVDDDDDGSDDGEDDFGDDDNGVDDYHCDESTGDSHESATAEADDSALSL